MILYLLIFQNYQAVKDSINFESIDPKKKTLSCVYCVFQKEGFNQPLEI